MSEKGRIVLVEQRVRISATRVRIPDLCIVEELQEVVTKAPLLCVEVLSPDDRWSRVISSVSDYKTMGVPCVWVIDAYQVRAWTFESANPPVEVKDNRISAQSLGIEVQLKDVLP